MSSRGKRREALRWLYSFVLPKSRQIAGLAGLSLVATLMVIAQPWITKLIIDEGLIAADFDRLWKYAVLSFAVGLAGLLLSGYSRLAHTQLSGDVLFALREDIFKHLLKLPPSFFAVQRMGDISSRIDRDVAEIQRFAVDTLFSAFSSTLGLVGAVAMMLFLNWQLSLVLAVLLPLEFLWLRKMRPKAELRNRSFREKSADLSAFFAEKLPAIKTIQISGAAGVEANRLSGLNHRLMSSLLQLQKTEFLISAVPSTLVSLARLNVLLVGGYMVVTGHFEVGALIAFITYVGMAIGPVQSLLGVYLAWQRLTVSLDRISVLRSEPIDERELKGSLLPADGAGALRIEGIHFQFYKDLQLLADISAVIPAGYKVGIVGASGIGKSTLLDVMTGFIQPKSGTVILDDSALSDIKPSSWRTAFAIASQEPQLFYDTLRNNICYGEQNVDEEAMLSAIDAAGLSPLVAQLPNGLETLIGERGTTLSGGERQRVALARTLLKRPRVLILDEPISAADPDTGRAIVEAVDRAFPTTTRIIVSHRIEAVAGSNLYFRLVEGQLIPVEFTELVT